MKRAVVVGFVLGIMPAVIGAYTHTFVNNTNYPFLVTVLSSPIFPYFQEGIVEPHATRDFNVFGWCIDTVSARAEDGPQKGTIKYYRIPISDNRCRGRRFKIEQEQIAGGGGHEGAISLFPE